MLSVASTINLKLALHGVMHAAMQVKDNVLHGYQAA